MSWAHDRWARLVRAREAAVASGGRSTPEWREYEAAFRDLGESNGWLPDHQLGQHHLSQLQQLGALQDLAHLYSGAGEAVIDDDSEGVAEAEALRADVEKAVRDDSVPDIRRGFEDVLDGLATSRSSSVRLTPEPTRAEQDEDRRFELEVRAAIPSIAGEALASHGIRVVAALDDGEGTGFVFSARDGAGRPYEARLLFADASAEAAERGADGMVRRCAGRVVESVLAARARYFERMM